jgi:hypothetical protein
MGFSKTKVIAAACTVGVIACGSTVVYATNSTNSDVVKYVQAVENKNAFDNKVLDLLSATNSTFSVDATVTSDAMQYVSKLYGIDEAAEDSYVNTFDKLNAKISFGATLDTEVSCADGNRSFVTASADLNGTNWLTINAIPDALNRTLYLSVPDYTNGWAKFSYSDIAEDASDDETTYLLSETEYCEDDYKLFASDVSSWYTAHVTSKNTTMENVYYNVNGVEQKAKKTVTTLNTRDTEDVMLEFSETIKSDSFKEMFPFAYDYIVSVNDYIGIDIEDYSVENDVYFDSLKVTTYTDANKNILGRDLTLSVVVNNDGTVENGDITLTYGTAKTAKEFGTELVLTVTSDDTGKLFNAGVKASGTISDLDKLSGTATIYYDDFTEDNSRKLDIDFKDYSYLAGLEGYITGEFTLPLVEFEDDIDAYYEDKSSTSTDEEYEQELLVRDFIANSCVTLTFDKTKEGAQTCDIALNYMKDTLTDVLFTINLDSEEHTVDLPKTYTEYSSISDYMDTIDSSELIAKLYTALGIA